MGDDLAKEVEQSTKRLKAQLASERAKSTKNEKDRDKSWDKMLRESDSRRGRRREFSRSRSRGRRQQSRSDRRRGHERDRRPPRAPPSRRNSPPRRESKRNYVPPSERAESRRQEYQRSHNPA